MRLVTLTCGGGGAAPPNVGGCFNQGNSELGTEALLKVDNFSHATKLLTKVTFNGKYFIFKSSPPLPPVKIVGSPETGAERF